MRIGEPLDQLAINVFLKAIFASLESAFLRDRRFGMGSLLRDDMVSAINSVLNSRILSIYLRSTTSALAAF